MKEKISVVTPSSRWETRTIDTMVIHCEKKFVTPSSRWELLTITVNLQCLEKYSNRSEEGL